MDFLATDEQSSLRELLRDVRADLFSSAQVREAAANGMDHQAWKQLSTEIGLAGLMLAEDDGGAGASFLEAAVVVEELGAVLAPVPMLSAVVVQAALRAAAGSPAAAELAARVAPGDHLAVVALGPGVRAEGQDDGASLTGTVSHVLDGPAAGTFLVAARGAGGERLYVVDASQVEVRSPMTLDQTRRQATLSLNAAPGTVLPGADPERIRDVQLVLLAVESYGAASALLEQTVAYLQVREQFGRPLGTFQALKHRVADLFVAIEAAKSTVDHAVWAVAEEPDSVGILAPLAAGLSVEAFVRTAGEALQLHGGIGFTWEHDVHLFLKRAKSSQLLIGGVAANLAKAAVRSGAV
ncbi:MAG: acyl-CoA dehydrogenase family protein [Actinomycetota bacterium]